MLANPGAGVFFFSDKVLIVDDAPSNRKEPFYCLMRHRRGATNNKVQ